jgi:hypothetical protein
MRCGLRARSPWLRQLPGRRLFQYRSEDGVLRQVNAHDVNRFLREIAGVEIWLKDFRTLLASVAVLDALACAAPATSKRAPCNTKIRTAALSRRTRRYPGRAALFRPAAEAGRGVGLPASLVRLLPNAL